MIADSRFPPQAQLGSPSQQRKFRPVLANGTKVGEHSDRVTASPLRRTACLPRQRRLTTPCMLPSIQALLVLQDRDRRLRALAEDLAKLPKEEARAKDRLAGDTAAVAKAKEALQAGEIEIKKIELDSGTRKTTIARLKVQQFETRKNDEFTALGNEIVRYEKEVDELETKELEFMERADSLRATLSAAEAALAKTRQLVEEDLATLADRNKRLEAETAEVQAERDRLAAAAPADQLPLYERLLKIKNGVAVVPVDAGKCGGCHIKLVSATLVKVKSGTEGVQCESCGRLLYDGD